MLKLVLPKGSLERATLELFSAADLTVERSSSVDYKATIADPRVDSVAILRPQEIPRYVQEGLFDIGITGRDWVEETGSDVVSLGRLGYSKATSKPISLVLAVAGDSPVMRPEDLAGLGLGRLPRVATEYPSLTGRWLRDRGVEADVAYSFGATEAKVPEIADAVVELTETGRAIRAAGLRIVDTLLESHTELIANKDAVSDERKAHAMHQLHTLLEGALQARDQVLLKLNVVAPSLEAVLAVLPAMRSPTVSRLAPSPGSDLEAFALETVVAKASVNTLIPALKDAGATDILELALSKIVR